MRGLLVGLVFLAGCSLYFEQGDDEPSPPPSPGLDAGPAPDPNVIERPCLRAMAPYRLNVGATAHPNRLFITYVCEGGAIIDTMVFDGAQFVGTMPRGDFQDSSDRLIADGEGGIMMISAHREELWYFSYNSGHRVSFERGFDDLWLGDVDGDAKRDFVLAGDNALRIASATHSTYGFPLDVLASSEHEVATGKPFHYVAVADLVGDTGLDLFYVAGGGGSAFEIGIADQSGATFETVVEPQASSVRAQPLRTHDVDGDGKLDIVGATSRLFVRSSKYGTTLFLDEGATAIAASNGEMFFITADKASVRRLRVVSTAGVPKLISEPLLAEGGDALESSDFDGDDKSDVVLLQNRTQPSSRLVFRLATDF